MKKVISKHELKIEVMDEQTNNLLNPAISLGVCDFFKELK
jgi:hypothetical protein